MTPPLPQPTRRTCPKCGEGWNEAQTVCSHCGQKWSAPQVEPRMACSCQLIGGLFLWAMLLAIVLLTIFGGKIHEMFDTMATR